MMTVEGVRGGWRALLSQLQSSDGRKAVAGETLIHLATVLLELGLPEEAKRLIELGWAFLAEVAATPCIPRAEGTETPP